MTRLAKPPRYAAIHEAGHAVAAVVVLPLRPDQSFGTDLQWAFERVTLRSLREAPKPYIDVHGRSSARFIGVVENAMRYVPIGNIHDRGGALDPIWGGKIPAPMHWQNMRADNILSLAGPTAEARWSATALDDMTPKPRRERPLVAVPAERWREWNWCCLLGRDDVDAVHRNAVSYARSDVEYTAIMEEAHRDTVALIEREDVWKAINAFSDVMLDRRTLDGVEATRIIREFLDKP